MALLLPEDLAAVHASAKCRRPAPHVLRCPCAQVASQETHGSGHMLWIARPDLIARYGLPADVPWELSERLFSLPVLKSKRAPAGAPITPALCSAPPPPFGASRLVRLRLWQCPTYLPSALLVAQALPCGPQVACHHAPAAGAGDGQRGPRVTTSSSTSPKRMTTSRLRRPCRTGPTTSTVMMRPAVPDAPPTLGSCRARGPCRSAAFLIAASAHTRA